MTLPDVIQFIRRNKLRLYGRLTDRNPTSPYTWLASAVHWRCSMRNSDDRSFTFTYSHGSQLSGEPKLPVVLDYLIQHSRFADLTLTAFAEEFGNEPDIPETIRAWQATRHDTARFIRFLGLDAFHELKKLAF